MKEMGIQDSGKQTVYIVKVLQSAEEEYNILKKYKLTVKKVGYIYAWNTNLFGVLIWMTTN